MFTITQIQAAHSKVKSGADFPAYILEIKKLGVTRYETFIEDGHTNYYAIEGHKTTSPARYDSLFIAPTANPDQFKADLKAHQKGASNYLTFCCEAAESGIEKWIVCLDQMNCTYYDRTGTIILVEQIPY